MVCGREELARFWENLEGTRTTEERCMTAYSPQLGVGSLRPFILRARKSKRKRLLCEASYMRSPLYISMNSRSVHYVDVRPINPAASSARDKSPPQR